MLPGYDLVAQAESGLMSITGDVDGDPMPVGSPVSDLTAGMLATLSILAAIRVRDQTGQGQRIDISLLEAAISLLGNVASNYLISGEEAPRYGNGHPNIAPYQSFATRNGRMIVACGNDHLYLHLCRALDRQDLASDPSFATNAQRVQNRGVLIPLLQKIFLQKDTEVWLSLLHSAGIPCGPIRSVSTVFHDPQIQARGLVWECEHPTAGTISLLGSPLHLSETPPRLYKAPPLLGEDNAKVFNEAIPEPEGGTTCLLTTHREHW
jgi:crotonobetainyl-CoA:carnitine CoA-transferase CaiB-like acyl-CoA transferase